MKKKTYLFLGLIVVFLMVAASFKLPPSGNPVPEDLNLVFKNSCMTCHATGGGMIATAKVNFSKWNEYDNIKQAKKAASICNTTTKGFMPPKSFIKGNPGAALTDEQKAKICKWSADLNPNK